MIVIVIPFHNGRFLMVNHPKRGWEFPGGKNEMGENEVECAIREAKEEAGIILKFIKEIWREGDMVVFLGEIEKFLPEHEMERKIFDKPPENLSFGREEAEKFLKIAHSNFSSSR